MAFWSLFIRCNARPGSLPRRRFAEMSHFAYRAPSQTG